VEKFAKAEFVGVKLHPMYQNFAADEDRLEPIYAACEASGLTIAIHAGRDIAFPPEDDRAAPLRLRRVLERFPDLKLICTHLGGWENWDEVEQHLIGGPALLETSFSLARMDAHRARQMIETHGPEKVMFGSDWPWNRQDEEISRVQSLHLDQSTQRSVLYRNAARLLGY
ncbi:MAG: amidohydrolase family protein, partial [Planctomycetota bacterium]